MKPVVLIEWVDSVSTATQWSDRKDAAPDEMRKSLTCVTAGFLLHEEPDMVVVAGSYQPDSTYVHHAIAIPRGAITSIERVRE